MNVASILFFDEGGIDTEEQEHAVFDSHGFQVGSI
jgi:hypothetical protein